MNHILGSFKGSVDSRCRKVMLPLCCLCENLTWRTASSSGVLIHKEDWSESRGGLDHQSGGASPLRGETELGLLNLEKRWLQGGIIVAFQYLEVAL